MIGASFAENALKGASLIASNAGEAFRGTLKCARWFEGGTYHTDLPDIGGEKWL